MSLNTRGEKIFGHIPKKISKQHQLISYLNKQAQSNDIIQKTKEAENELDELLKEKEIWWAQGSRENWIKLGD